MIIRKYKSTDCKYLAQLFYDTVHSVNSKDYSKEQLDAWANGNIDLKQWDESFKKIILLLPVSYTHLARYQEGDIVPYFTITFEGTGIELYGNKDTMMGIYDITVDDGEVIQVDAYNPSTLYQQLLFSVTGLEYGQHTIKVSATRNKNENSTSSDIEIDYAKILYDQDIQEVDKTALKIAVDLANAVTDKDLEKVIPVVANEFKAARRCV